MPASSIKASSDVFSVSSPKPPDRLSLLVTGAEFENSSAGHIRVTVKYGTGCGQLGAMFTDFEAPPAVIEATDIAMRPYLPRDTLAFTVTTPMFERLHRLDENSFLAKTFWSVLKRTRNEG